MHHEVLAKEGAALFPLLRSFPGYYLAGGTALALQIGHRISVDFDLFSDDLIPKSLLPKAQQAFGTFPVEPLINNRDELTLIANGVKVTFLSYRFPILRPLVPWRGVRMLSIGEIAATKAYSICRRGTFKDYVDLYFTIKERHATLDDVIVLAEQKFGTAFNSRLFAEQLLFMDDISDYQLEFLRPPVDPAEMRDFFKAAIEELNIAPR
jgi:Nucleotidyl transferase AbiEii toxin, Type IV TA system